MQNATFFSLDLSYKKLHNIRFLFHSQFLTDDTLPLIYRPDALLANDTDFLGREIGTEQATELDFFFVQEFAIVVFQMRVVIILNVIDGAIQVFPIEQRIYRYGSVYDF